MCWGWFITPEAKAVEGSFVTMHNPLFRRESASCSPWTRTISALMYRCTTTAADDFAWIVPVASVPDVGVGTDEVFTRLDQLTNPIFQIDYEIDPTCNFIRHTRGSLL